MDITLKDKNGVTLHTAKKHCKEDITVRMDTQEISIIPSTEEQVKEGLFNSVLRCWLDYRILKFKRKVGKKWIKN